MVRRAARRRWRDTRGLGEIFGGMGAWLLIIFGLTGALGVFQLWQTHTVLNQAAQVALQSEEEQGCWNSRTSQVVAAVLQNGGLNPAGVKITNDTTTQADYGHEVSVGLNYTMGTHFLFGGLMSWTEHAGQNGLSFYVPTATAGAASGCSTPDLQPATTTPTPSATPEITNVVFSGWTQYGATLTIDGSGLGALTALSNAAGGGDNSPVFNLSYDGQNIGHDDTAWGLNYVSWSPTQIVVQYPGTWTVPGDGVGDSLPLDGGSITVDVWNGRQEASATVAVPNQPNSDGLTLSSNATNPLTGQSVTLTATTNVATGSNAAINLVDTTTGHVVAHCTDATQCSATITNYTQNQSVSQTYVANIGPPGSVSGTGTSNTVAITWSPAAQITATRWWLDPPNTTVTSDLTLPLGDNSALWWSFSVQDNSVPLQGWSQDWDSPVVKAATYSPTDTTGWLDVGDLLPGAHHVVLTFYFNNGAIQEVDSPTITMVTPSVTLAANPTDPDVNTASTLTATSNFNLTGTGLAINIIDQTTGQVVQQCTSGTTCTVSETQSNDATDTFVADIGPAGAMPGASGVVTQSNAVTVTWSWTVTLSASTDNTAPGNDVTLTANVSSAIGNNYLVIDDTTNGDYQVTNCYDSTSCTAVVSETSETTQDYIARVVPYSWETYDGGSQSDTVAVTWAWTLTLSTSTTSTQPYYDVTLMAQSNATTYGEYINIMDGTSGQLVQTCWYGSSCSVDVTQYDITTQNYYADIGGYNTPDYEAIVTSNSVSVQWTWTISLTANATSLSAGNATYLQANASGDVYGNWINIVDTTTGQIVDSCWYTSYCGVSVEHYSSQTQTYEADIGNNGAVPGDAEVASNAVSVTWTPITLSLSASPATTVSGNDSLLTVSASGQVGAHYLDIYDVSTGQVIQDCWDSSSCSVNVNPDQPESQTYQAEVSNVGYGWNPILSSNTQTVTWTPLTVSLSASSTSLSVGNSALLTATTNKHTGSNYLDIYDQSTGQSIAQCWDSTSCTVNVSQDAAETQQYQAEVTPNWYEWDPNWYSEGGYEESSAMNVSWTAPTVSLSASPSAPYIDNSTALTATASSTINGDYLDIVDQSTGQVLVNCYESTSCTADVSQSQAETQTYQAQISWSWYEWSPAYSSSTVPVTWSINLNAPYVSSMSTGYGYTYPNGYEYQIMVSGENLPILTNSDSTPGAEETQYEWDYPNFLFQMEPQPNDGGESVGSTIWPYGYQTDWGIEIVSSSSTELTFALEEDPNNSWWYLWLEPDGQSVQSDTPYTTDIFY